MTRFLIDALHILPFALVPLGIVLVLAAVDGDLPGYVAMRFVCGDPVWVEREHRRPGWECPVVREVCP